MHLLHFTQQKEIAEYTSIEKFDLPDDAPPILKDEIIEVICTINKVVVKQQMGRVVFDSAKYKKAVFIENYKQK